MLNLLFAILPIGINMFPAMRLRKSVELFVIVTRHGEHAAVKNCQKEVNVAQHWSSILSQPRDLIGRVRWDWVLKFTIHQFKRICSCYSTPAFNFNFIQFYTSLEHLQSHSLTYPSHSRPPRTTSNPLLLNTSQF